MTRKIIHSINILFFIINIVEPKCRCLKKEVHNIENTIHYTNLQLRYLGEILHENNKILKQKEFLLNKWRNCYDEFQDYMVSLKKENKICSSSYRFLRWLHITNKKLFTFIKELKKQLNQVINEKNHIELPQDFGVTLNCNKSELDLNNVINSLNLAKDHLEQLEGAITSLIEQSLQFKSILEELIDSEQFDSCCCWY